jgi:HEAT repeat protein
MGLALLGVALLGFPARVASESPKDWLAELAADDVSRRREAVSHLKHLGSDALPLLVPALDSTDPKLRRRAVCLLRELGPQAVGAATELMRTMELDIDVAADGQLALQALRLRILYALQNLKASAAPAVGILIDALNSGEKQLRAPAAAALAEIGPEAHAAEPALARVLRSRDGITRINAAAALWRIEGNKVDVMPVLLEGLEDADADARDKAATTLTSMADHPDSIAAYEAVIPVLIGALADPDEEVRSAVVLALSRPAAEDAVIRALKYGDTAQRTGAAKALARQRSDRAHDILKAIAADATHPAHIAAQSALPSIREAGICGAPPFQVGRMHAALTC